jgi:hypothetical protein
VSDALVAQQLAGHGVSFPSMELADHMPENDAEYIWRMHMAVLKAIHSTSVF